jgi:hypothetical protein
MPFGKGVDHWKASGTLVLDALLALSIVLALISSSAVVGTLIHLP